MANDRLTRISMDVLVEPTSQKVRLSRVSMDVLVQPTSQKVRLSRLSMDVLIGPDLPSGIQALLLGGL